LASGEKRKLDRSGIGSSSSAKASTIKKNKEEKEKWKSSLYEVYYNLESMEKREKDKKT